MEVKGTLSLTANSDGANKCKVVLASTDSSGAFTFQTHPKVWRALICVYLLSVLLMLTMSYFFIPCGVRVNCCACGSGEWQARGGRVVVEGDGTCCAR